MSVLRLWVLPSNGFETVPTVREQLREYLRERPDTRVEITVKTAVSLWQSLFLLLKRPQEAARPDIIELPQHWTSTLAHLGLLEDLLELEPGLDLSPWPASGREHCGLPGAPGVFSLPWWTEVTVLYYRRDLLRRLGVDPRSALDAWEGFEDVCRRAASARRLGDCRPVANANPRDAVSLVDVAPAVWSRGGDFFSRDGSRCLFHREEAFDGIRGYLALLDRGWMPLLGKSGLVPRSLFDGGSVLQFWGRAPIPAARGRGEPLELGAVPCPRASRGRAGVWSSHHLAVVRGGGPPREALALLRHLTRPRQAARFAAALGAFPCAEPELTAAFAAAGAFGDAFRAAHAASRPLPNLPALGTLERIFDRSMENLLRAILRRSYDEQSLRQELIYAAAEMDYVLSQHQGRTGLVAA